MIAAFRKDANLKCTLCKKVIINRRGCLYYKVDYEALAPIGRERVVALCSYNCSLRFQGVPRKKSG